MPSSSKFLNLRVMRKRLEICLMLLCVLPALSGCDFLRKAAGRPTSADIEIKRQQIVLAEQRRREVEDSLAREECLRQQRLTDSLAVMDSLAKAGCLIRNQSETGRIVGKTLSARYWLVTGAFRKPENARRRCERMEASGFTCEIVSFGSGLDVVLAAPNNTLRGIYGDYRRYVESEFKTPDVWILDAAPEAAQEKR